MPQLMLPLADAIPGATGHEPLLVWLIGLGFLVTMAVFGLFWRTFSIAEQERFAILDASIARRVQILQEEIREVKDTAKAAFDANLADHKQFAEAIARHDVIYRVVERRWLNTEDSKG